MKWVLFPRSLPFERTGFPANPGVKRLLPLKVKDRDIGVGARSEMPLIHESQMAAAFTDAFTTNSESVRAPNRTSESPVSIMTFLECTAVS